MDTYYLNRIEFHRDAVAMLPEKNDPDPGIAFYKGRSVKSLGYDSCTCAASAKATCVHQKELSRIMAELEKQIPEISLSESFRRSMWEPLAETMNNTLRAPLSDVTYDQPDDTTVCFYRNSSLLATVSGHEPEITLLLERLGLHTPVMNSDKPDPSEIGTPRAELLEQLYKHTRSDSERQMLTLGRQTRRQAFEQSFWFRLSYHGFVSTLSRESDLTAAVEPETVSFSYSVPLNGSGSALKIHVPPASVKNVMKSLEHYTENTDEFAVSETPAESVLEMSLTESNDLVMELYLKHTLPDGSETLYPRKSAENYRYGDLIYLKETSLFTEIRLPDPLIEKFKGKFRRVVKNDKIPALLDSYGDSLWGRPDKDIISDSVKHLKIHKSFDRMILSPEALDRDWCWLDVSYGFGNSRVSLVELLEAKRAGRRFIPLENGWIDCHSIDLDSVSAIPGLDVNTAGAVKITGPGLFRLKAASEKPVDISGETHLKHSLEKLFDMKPSMPLPLLKGMSCTLRKYQVTGVQWLTFLYDNGLSGLLCDDMGLGKTHQVMAFMVWLREVKNVKGPFLVVAPVTVMSHWETKLKEYAPSLSCLLHHGTDRHVEKSLHKHDVIVTSYGILRKDRDLLSELRFSLAVFDEAQNLKNRETQTYSAARIIPADMKLGVTGTPIENELNELKALMDLSFPGYLGLDDTFESRYVKPISCDFNSKRKMELSRIIKPFTIRRLKTSVLSELPEKIEDIRYCLLSEDQLRLYREAIESRGSDFIKALKSESKLPYMHIFALLSTLKQICNHPALIKKDESDYTLYASGKWDLFQTLLNESLASGQKTVIYTQYVGMVNIIDRHLKQMGVNAVTLTGSSKNRGKLIDRFNNDPDCSVFVGSLLAGGTGIDLVSASVVIHYDRWWNAAKEDQATDRVHRIGQTRGVQVFKLVTKGTLEEKISAIIESKRNLMDSIVTEDDPNLLKTFSRDQLLELLTLPVETLSARNH